MTSLHDLRETLERHADGLDDTQRWARPVALRERIRAARRRRATGAAVAAAVVLVTGAAAVGSLTAPDRVGPAAPRVAGVEVPRAVTVTGFGYELASTESFDGDRSRVRLAVAPADRVVSLVADGLGSGSATLYRDGEAVARAFGSDAVAVPVPVPGRSTLQLRLHDAPREARAGVAVYGSTGDLAPGVSDGDVVFRSEVAGARLLDAAFSEEGEARAAVSFTAPVAGTRITAHCRSEERGLWLRVDVEGAGSMRGQCGNEVLRDPGGSSSFGGPTSGRHTVEAFLTRGMRGEVVADAEADLGVAVYRSGESVRLPDTGMDVAVRVEHAGRAWRLDTSLSGPVTEADARRVEAADSDLLLGFVAQGEMVRATWRGELTRGGTAYVGSSTGPGTLIEGLLLRGDTYDVALEADGELVGGALLVYRPL